MPATGTAKVVKNVGATLSKARTALKAVGSSVATGTLTLRVEQARAGGRARVPCRAPGKNCPLGRGTRVATVAAADAGRTTASQYAGLNPGLNA